MENHGARSARRNPMIWKTPAGTYLLQGAVERIPLGMSICLPNGESLSSCAKFYEASSRGNVLQVFLGPMEYSLDDTLGISDIHHVLGTDLYAFHWIDHAMNEPIVKEEIVLSGLIPCDPKEIPFDVAHAIASYESR
jgi:hypothetical protein